MKSTITFSTLILLLIFTVSCKQNAPTFQGYDVEKTAISSKAMVVSAHPLATKAGIDILEKGGNAVDAAIAVQLALAVVYPNAGNLGGGGFMVLRDKDGNVKTLDYREKAPLAAHRDMYLDSLGNVTDKSVYGHLAVGVPGTVAGLFESMQYAKLDFKELIAPAIELAEKGFYTTEQQAESLNDKMPDFKEFNTTMPVFVKEEGWKKGELMIQKDLAATLKRIRDNGKAGFYEGETADLFVKEMEAGGGIITKEDLKKYNAKWREPITFNYKNYEIHSMPPASSGGVCLAQMLGMVEHYPLSEYGFQSTNAVHLMVEAERRAYADRTEHLGDADFYNVPLKRLTNEEYLTSRMENFDVNRASVSKRTDAGTIPESEETTHLSVVDADGNAVSITTTLNLSFGSKVVVSGAGFVLNNEMDDFSAKPGVPNSFGLIGKEANAIQPEKRMLSSMTPTIVEKEGKLFMVIGTPGGSTIITSVYQSFLNVAEFGMTMTESVQARRFHHQWLPDVIFYEEATDTEKATFTVEQIKLLEAKGHTMEARENIGRVDAILVREDGTFEGAADTRGDDHAEGI
jgi:gamma-glutamyltranspeptidase/glutathione hydrolase